MCRLFSVVALAGIAAAAPSRAAGLPTGFSQSLVAGPHDGAWDDANGITYARDGRVFVWERGGRVWTQARGDTTWALVLDISEEVGHWRDFGLLSVAVDPRFETNGFIYLMYVVDRHHLLHFGTSSYDATINDYASATIGRITRYTTHDHDGVLEAHHDSRRVLVGESASTGLPILYASHGVGTLVFGTDGTLLASCGEGAHFGVRDRGSAAGSYFEAALADGIIRPDENVGCYRAQQIDSLSGKIIRIDPATGDGIPGNPFYDENAPRAARSRVWALGLRNPYRVALRTGSGSHDPRSANPGVLLIGDVGDVSWEELDVCTHAGQNFGWPLFEGLEPHAKAGENVRHLAEPNPLADDDSACAPYLYFRQLIAQTSLRVETQPPFANPCAPTEWLPSTIPQFVHTPPVLEWQRDVARVRTWRYGDDGSAEPVAIGTAESPVTGNVFIGNCSVGGTWYAGEDFPVEYHDSYFHADFGGRWIRHVTFADDHRPIAVRGFLSHGGMIVALATSPVDGGLTTIAYTDDLTTELRRISYVGERNLPPEAHARAEPAFGPGPLEVRFSSEGSHDPEGSPLAYHWDFGDGTEPGSGTNPVHVFVATGDAPALFTVTLTVVDQTGLSGTTTLPVAVNNTPPVVTITSPVSGTRYPLTRDSVYLLSAEVSDRESGADELTYAWQTILHHNEHIHLEPVDHRPDTATVITPLGCDGDNYHYRVVLTVTDAAGLSTQAEVVLEPDCDSLEPPTILTSTVPGGRIGDPYTVLLEVAHGTGPYTWSLAGGALPEGLALAADTGRISGTPEKAGAFALTLQVGDAELPARRARQAVVLAIAPEPPSRAGRLVNLSIRARSGAGERALIAGFQVAAGTDGKAKPLLLRGVGPTLAAHGVAGCLLDPVARLYRDTTLLDFNDDWQGARALAIAGTATGAFAYAADDSHDAALLAVLGAGGYTLHVVPASVADEPGIALAECYDAADTFTARSPRLVNISGRGFVGANDDIMVAGFAIAGSTPVRVLLRAIGPTLADKGVAEALADPVLELYSGSTLWQRNDDWQGDEGLASAMAAVGAFSLHPDSRDAAMLVDLPPGLYTAQARGGAGHAGIALVEVYAVPTSHQ